MRAMESEERDPAGTRRLDLPGGGPPAAGRGEAR